ncbi:MAG: hypothetical protein BWK80_19005 [Desulfobacteraceae bacterium IS3]|nr:MAG: hypothetical protein BWK80_19005 [Desulfobacteraceae bacterium IS3]
MTSLFLIFNHKLTPEQESDAKIFLGIKRMIEMPSHLKELWQQIPPDSAQLSNYLTPFKDWLHAESVENDYALIQGDFGACFLMVNFAFEIGLIPVYATTRREAVEERLTDGNIKLTHQFRHQRFRKYEK